MILTQKLENLPTESTDKIAHELFRTFDVALDGIHSTHFYPNFSVGETLLLEEILAAIEFENNWIHKSQIKKWQAELTQFTKKQISKSNNSSLETPLLDSMFDKRYKPIYQLSPVKSIVGKSLEHARGAKISHRKIARSGR